MVSTSMLILIAFGVFIGLVIAYITYAYFATVAQLKKILESFPVEDAEQLFAWDREGLVTLYPVMGKRILAKIYDEVSDDVALKMAAMAENNKLVRFS